MSGRVASRNFYTALSIGYMIHLPITHVRFYIKFRCGTFAMQYFVGVCRVNPPVDCHRQCVSYNVNYNTYIHMKVMLTLSIQLTKIIRYLVLHLIPLK